MAKHEIISWDFDGTLYDAATNSLYAETKALFDKQNADSDNIMIICTYRSKSDAKQIDKFFEYPNIVATNGQDKVATLMDKFPFFKIVAHYDDDVFTVNDFDSTGIRAYFVYDPNDPKSEDDLAMLNPRVVKFPIDKTKVV